MNRVFKKKNKGLSLVELLISVTSLTVMTTVSVSGVMKHYRSAKEERYKMETVAVFQAMQLYLMDLGGMSDEIYDLFFYEMTKCQLSKPRHILHRYLAGRVTDNTWIHRVLVVKGEFVEMAYLIDGYVIAARCDGTVYIEIYPGPDSPNQGTGFDPPKGP